MMSKESIDRRDRFAAEFDEHERRSDGRRIVNSLCYGLTELRGLFFTRVHADVERNFGRDSMVMPMSQLASEDRARLEIDIFQVATSCAQVQQRNYAPDPSWCHDWLRRLRLDQDADKEPVRKRLDRYREMTDEERRVGFSRVLEKRFPRPRTHRWSCTACFRSAWPSPQPWHSATNPMPSVCGSNKSPGSPPSRIAMSAAVRCSKTANGVPPAAIRSGPTIG